MQPTHKVDEIKFLERYDETITWEYVMLPESAWRHTGDEDVQGL